MSLTQLRQTAAPEPGPRLKGMGRRRAYVLIGVHVAFAIHIAFFHAKGRALSPVEPSESMQTLEYGALNAGFIFFALAILSSLLFGRFFCGWGCHLVALQDACSWLLKRAGIRPKPFRSRLLIWVPLVAALYMFVWPSALRMMRGEAAPKFANHLSTENFWVTFGSPTIGILTLLVCGFLAVVFLGNKGFCTYACPYGAFFGIADKFSPGRIRVTDACDGCGQCTAHCTSNVRVHEEVKLHKMVVDAGCMKCLDCIDNCPKQALYFGFGSVKAASKGKRANLYDLSLKEEVAALIGFVLGFYAYRGLFEQVPFLLSLALSGLTALATLSVYQLLTQNQVRVQRWQLKSKGKWTSLGQRFAVAIALFLSFTIYADVLQYYAHDASAELSIAQSIYDGKVNEPLEVAERHALAAKDGFEKALKLTPVPVLSYHLKLGGIAEFMEDSDAAEAQYKRALELAPSSVPALIGLCRTYEAKQEWDRAAEFAKKWLEVEPSSPRPHFILARAYTSQDKLADAIKEYEWLIAHDPKDAEVQTNIGMLQAMSGDLVKAEEHFKTAIELRPAKKEFVFNYGLMLAEGGRIDEAFVQFDKCIKLDPEFIQGYVIKMDVAVKHARWNDVLTTGDALLKKAPFNPEGAKMWALGAYGSNRINDLLSKLGEKPGDLYRKAALLHVSGKVKEADAAMNAVLQSGVNTAAPW